jgi:hypothetical protein
VDGWLKKIACRAVVAADGPAEKADERESNHGSGGPYQEAHLGRVDEEHGDGDDDADDEADEVLRRDSSTADCVRRGWGSGVQRSREAEKDAYLFGRVFSMCIKDDDKELRIMAMARPPQYALMPNCRHRQRVDSSSAPPIQFAELT